MRVVCVVVHNILLYKKNVVGTTTRGSIVGSGCSLNETLARIHTRSTRRRPEPRWPVLSLVRDSIERTVGGGLKADGSGRRAASAGGEKVGLLRSSAASKCTPGVSCTSPGVKRRGRWGRPDGNERSSQSVRALVRNGLLHEKKLAHEHVIHRTLSVPVEGGQQRARRFLHERTPGWVG